MPPDYPQQPQTPQPPVQAPSPQPVGPHPATYDFILNPEKPPKKPIFTGSGSGMNPSIIRIGVIAGGIFLLLIIFVIAKNVLFKGPDLKAYVTIAQDQQQLIHLASLPINTSQQQTISTADQNLAATINLALASNQAQIVSYLATNHQKVSTKTLSLKLNAGLDSQLATAQSAGTYDPTFKSILQSQLSSYINDLKRTYQNSTGKKGRQILKNDYDQAVLLLNQAAAPDTSS